VLTDRCRDAFPGSRCNQIRIAALAAVLLFMTPGCAPRKAPPALPPLPPVAANVLLQQVESCGAGVTALRGLAKVQLANGEKNVTVRQVILAGYPDRLRTETLSPFGSPLLVLASDGRNLDALLPGEGRFLHGPASAENLRRFTRLPLRLPDLVGLLLYRPPLFPWDAMRGGSGEAGERYRLFLDGPAARRQVFSFDAALRLSGAAYYDGKELLLEIGYGEFGNASTPFPRQAELQLPAHGVTAKIRFEEVELNADLPAVLFHLQPPPGVVVEELP